MLDSYSILLQMIETRSDKAGVFNWGGWSYPEIDKLIIQASTEMDRTKRLDLQTKEGRDFLENQMRIFFGFDEGELADTAWRPPDE